MDAALTPEEILERGHRERTILRELMALIQTEEQARVLYRDFPTGYHDRMHRYDLERALEVDCPLLTPTLAAKPYFDRFADTSNAIDAVHAADWERLDELAETGRTYREELMILACGDLWQQLRVWLGLPDDLPLFSPDATVGDLIWRVHRWSDDALIHIVSLDGRTLTRRYGWRPIAKHLDRLIREDLERRYRFRPINRRHTWAYQAGLIPT